MEATEIYHDLYADGACRGNPGQGSVGVVILAPSGEQVTSFGKYLGHCTNNIAEYQALILGLEASRARNLSRLRIFLDSELLVKQLNGDYQVKNERLKELHRQVLDLLLGLKSYTIKHVPRGLNKPADRLANEALDAALRQGAFF